MALTVVIPSAGRADRVRAVKAINADVLCVPESETAAYRRHALSVLARRTLTWSWEEYRCA